MRIALVTDAWTPQVNGVVRTLQATVAQLASMGHRVELFTPDQFATIPCPTYPEIRLALGAGGEVARRLRAFAPDAVHLATEGPLGWAARRWCLRSAMPFTTSYHTRFPDYVALRTGVPARLLWPVVRRFHAPATNVFAATATLERELHGHGLTRTHRWSRGVDLSRFAAAGPRHPAMADLPRPLLLHVGRIAIEKNVRAFLALPGPGTKVLVGDGPARDALARAYPAAVLLGALQGEELAAAYRSADALVFPSRTDTFGLVMVEAMASGVPVAAYPVAGPLDVIGATGAGAMHPDLAVAVDRALAIDPAICTAAARGFDWRRCTEQFVEGLTPQPDRALAA